VAAVIPLGWPEGSGLAFATARCWVNGPPLALHKDTVFDRGSFNEKNSRKETARWPQEL
jgi:hypothetical protein